MATEKPDLTQVWASNAPPGNVVDPNTTTPGKVAAGWQAEVPPFEHFNFLQKWFTQGLAHFNEQGIGVWDTNTTYPVNGIVKGSDGNIYIALVEQNGNDPISDTVNWKIFTDSLNVRNYGANGDGVTDDTTSVQNMISDVGYARFVGGTYLLTSTVIDAPLFFDAGASITVSSPDTVTIYDRINSPRQWIFKGDGDYILGHDSDSGEDARQIHASWFGAFPSLDMGTDMAPRIQNAIDSMGNARESVIDFDIGNYRVGQQIDVKRGCWIRGSGSRRTVFSQLTDGFVTFVTSEVAARFSNLQFENVGMTSNVRSSPYIRILHDDCDIYDIKCGRADTSIEIQANACRVDNVIYIFDLSAGTPSPGSSVIALRGNDCRISNILGNSSADVGPDYIVHVGANIGTLGCANTIIENIYGITPAIPVFLDATNVSLTRVNVDNITQNAFTGPTPEAVLKIESGGSNSVNGVIINGVLSTDHPANGLRILQNSTGTMQDIQIDNVVLDAMSGNGIEFSQTSGTLRQITVGSNTDVSECATPYSYSGSYSRIKVNPTAIENAMPAYCYDFSIADDDVAQIDLHRSVFTAFLTVTVGTSNYIVMVARAASSPAGTTINVSANVDTATTSLNGTTGTDGKFTVGITDSVIYLENRLGSSQRVSANIMTGVI